MKPESDPAANPSAPSETPHSFARRHCQPCEGGVDPIAVDRAKQWITALPEWELDESAEAISRRINGRTFIKVIELINQVARIAEEQQHHPDLHLTGYRHLKIVLTTHAIGGLSENDFIMAAKIDEGINR